MRVAVCRPLSAKHWTIALLAAMALMIVSVDRAVAAAPASVADAVKARDVAALDALLKSKADVTAPQADGTTALHWAVYWDDVPAAQRLLQAGAKVNVANRLSETPLSLACANANVAMIETLLKAGADANATFGEGETALMTAARTGKAEAVKVLLAHGADPRAAEGWRKQTALMWAATANSGPAVKTLIEGGADINAKAESGYTALHYAARGGATEAARVLVDAGADINARIGPGAAPLMLAVMNASYETAAMLVEKGAKVDDDGMGWNALHQLFWSYKPNVLHNPPGPELKGKMGNLNAYGLAKVLLEHGANPNARMNKEPRDGYRVGHWDNRVGATPILLAARVQEADMMRLLLSHGADPNLTSDDGTNLLLLAAGLGFKESEMSPFKPGSLIETVKLALELGGDVNSSNEFQWTPLHAAAWRGSSELIRLFVGLGADLFAVTREEHPGLPWFGKGKTALQVAEFQVVVTTVYRHPEQAALLRELMGLPPDTSLQTTSR